jgi:predicted AAA+ superfamily ATPase
MFKRILETQIKKDFFSGKIIVLVGARQTGKTTLSLELIKDSAGSVKFFNGDNPTDRDSLSNRDFDFLKNLIGDAKIIFIDEGQKIETIGQTLKLMVDNFKNQKQIIVTGSSAFNLLEKTQEPLTGRKFVFNLFPISLPEMYKDDLLGFLKGVESLLIYGSYPEVVSKTSFEEKEKILKEISSSYLYKDILEFQRIKSSDTLVKLLRALALQVGSEVSYTELANIVGINRVTLERYVDILEKNYIIFRLSPYAKNKRKIISKQRKIYFWDVGVRNAVIDNFSFLLSRNDVGALWENYAIAERLKYQAYNNISSQNYFWKTYSGAEIDLIEDRGGKIFAYEMKWNKNQKNINPPARWKEENPDSEFKIINPENINKFT